MTTTATLRPNGDVYNSGPSGAWTLSTGAVVNTLLNDNSDATYVSRGGNYAEVVVDFGTTTIPAGGRVMSVTPRVRGALSGADAIAYHPTIKLVKGGYPGSTATTTSQSCALPTTTITTETLAPYPTAWGTADPWVQADIDALQMYVKGSAPSTAWRVYELYLDVLYADVPTVVVADVTTTATITPVVSWAPGITNGAAQTRAHVKIFDSVTYGGGGFSADTSTPIYETTILGTDTSIAVPVGYLVSAQYKAYVMVSQTVNGTYQDSVWTANNAWTITLDQPGVPTLTVTADSTNFRAALSVQGHENILSEEDSSLEGATTGGWAGATNCTITNSTTQAIAPGTRSLRLSSSAAGNMSTRTASGTGGRPVVAARSYRARASFRAGATTRSARVDVIWYDSGGSVLSTSTGATPVSATSGAFVEAVENFTAPASSAFAAIVVNVLSTAAANELFYVDHIAIQEVAGAAPTLWSRGGLVGSGATGTLYWQLQYSDDAGVTWADVVMVDPVTPGTNQLATTVYDRFLTPTVTRQYQVLPYYIQGSSTVAGTAVAGSTTVNLDLTEWRLTDLTAGTALTVTVVSDGTKAHAMPAGVFPVLDSQYPVVVKDVRKAVTSTLLLQTRTSAARTALIAALDGGTSLLLQGPGAQMGGSRFIEILDVTEEQPDPHANPYLVRWTLPYVEVAQPAG